MKTDNLSNSLRWVILLLVAAVILPTVCLLWFMTQAVRNERLAVQQRLVDWYTKQAQYFFAEVPDLYFDGIAEHLHSYPAAETDRFFGTFAVGADCSFKGMLIYDTGGQLVYPPVAGETDDGAAALRLAVRKAEEFLSSGDERLLEHLRLSIGVDAFSDRGPAETVVWQLERLAGIARQANLATQLEREIASAEHRIKAYTNAYEAAYLYSSAAQLESWQDRTIRRLPGKRDLYGFKIMMGDRTVLGLSPGADVEAIFNAAIEDVQDETVRIQVRDNFGAVIAGIGESTEKAFLTMPAGKYLPEFEVSFYLTNAGVFEEAARRQTSIYMWTGFLVAAMVTVTGIAAVRTVGQQIKTNRLKNDFIATVTHELKTPLASMRVLVDTLLDKRYTDDSTADEYLRMIANENKRLTHLIDSFLTFSRMERNKQVFDFQSASPADIASGAVEAIRTKLSNHTCDFAVRLDENLPAVYADRDAMITVLVNLLDNACKYGKEDKRIQLRVYAENASVCFAVKDNGIGISKRQQKKIFGRFYQADSRLSRSVEGCGLGLSIVKFIVDAHKGTIDVDSKVGEGSTFTVRVPQV